MSGAGSAVGLSAVSSGGESTFRVAKEKIGLNGQCSLLSPLSSLLISLVVRVEAVLHERLTSMAS